MTENSASKFGFIVHCRNTRELRLVTARYRVSPACLLPEKRLKANSLKSGVIEDIFTFDRVVSDQGHVCQGKAYCILLTPEQLIENQALATELVIKACHMAEQWGAQMIGLGAICAVVGARGVEAARHCRAAVTTGNSLTAYSAFIAYEHIIQRLETDPRSHRVAIVGFPGSISLVITKMLHERGIDLILVSRRKTAFLNKFLDSVREGPGSIEITQDIGSALKKARIVFTATSAGNIIDQDMLLPGSVVFDIAQPKDVVYRKKPRRDVLIIDAGLISMPRSTTKIYRYSGWLENDIPSCLGETIALTFENRWENFSLGRELTVENVREIGELSRRHGFVFDDFRTFERPIDPDHFAAAKRALHQAC